MMIRPEQEQDHDAIAAVIAQAFAEMEHSDQTEAAIVAALRNAGALSLSLVAQDGAQVIGHVAFSPVMIDGKNVGWFGLGPLSVHPDRQGGGVGGALIRQGLDQLQAQGAAGCVVLGDPGYYRRFGFENDSVLRYDGAPPEYFMRISFGASAPVGLVEYHSGFGSN